ncbi:F-box/LRR-repeat protein At4g14103-like [Gastrolobium bilobum]|uniref:F-box/LRR-repeat protein At4g14103-like n=1 Tax=Gastrolobium bilobum TaxID=150636 RepID=UPI002AAF63B6|nr:F-box/LRR-repeat protein At4g14103-like [Gastrolobium bilobum]
MKPSIEVEEEEEESSNEDRLSNLSDETIHHILFFMDAKSAIQMSVLSKRWRYLWTSLPVLNFLDWSFDNPVIFRCFVKHVLSHRDASTNLNMLKLVCNGDVNVYIVHFIINYLIPRGIQDLSILAECCVRKLPQLSACHSLTTLKLAYIATETTTFDSVSLQHLYIFQCEFMCSRVEELDPFSGCPNLRCLQLLDCSYFSKIQKFQIHAPQLTDLSISNMRVHKKLDSDCVIELFTPKLQSFSYSDSKYLYDFSIKVNLPFIEKVNFDIGSFQHYDEFMARATNLSLKLIDFFEVMGSAKFVYLSAYIIVALSTVPALLDGRSSPFTSLKNFELTTDTHIPLAIPINVMAYLFGGSPGFDCGRYKRGIILDEDMDPLLFITG